MAGGADGDGDAFAFDGADVGGDELAEGVRADEDGVAGVDDAWELLRDRGGCVGGRTYRFELRLR